MTTTRKQKLEEMQLYDRLKHQINNISHPSNTSTGQRYKNQAYQSEN